MASGKRSAWAKQKAEFAASLNAGENDIFARESRRQARRAEEKEVALRNKACESKNRYATHREAEEAIAACAEHGTRGLRSYQCAYCKGWHLTSKPQ